MCQPFPSDVVLVIVVVVVLVVAVFVVVVVDFPALLDLLRLSLSLWPS